MGLNSNRKDALEVLENVSTALFNVVKARGEAGYIADEIAGSSEASAIIFIRLCKKEGWRTPLEMAAAMDIPSEKVRAQLEKTLFSMNSNPDAKLSAVRQAARKRPQQLVLVAPQQERKRVPSAH